MFEELARQINPQQLEMAKVIAEEFQLAGLPANVAAGAIANAWHESRLNPNAIGDNGQSVGLFQLYSQGAGAGMSVEERKDPRINARRIIEVVKKKWDKFAPVTNSVAQSAKVFTIYVEIPANKEQKAEERAITARHFFPTDSVSYDGGGKMSPLLVALLFIVPIGSLGLAWYYYNVHNKRLISHNL